MSIKKENDTEISNINKSDLDLYLKELSKELKKEFGRDANIELIIVGGASILLNYDFRDTTRDIDAIILSRSSIKGAINRVGDKYNLETGWVNSDFCKTTSYSPKLVEHSKYYRTYNQVLTIRTIGEEYLVAMKLASMRNYKNDLSDIIGIINSDGDMDITYEKIDQAVGELYGGWENMPEGANGFIKQVLDNGNRKLYMDIKQEEIQNKELLTNFENLYDNVLNTNNIDVILSTLKEKKLKERDSEFNLKNNSESLLNKLEQCKKKIVKDDQNREKGVRKIEDKSR